MPGTNPTVPQDDVEFDSEEPPTRPEGWRTRTSLPPRDERNDVPEHEPARE